MPHVVIKGPLTVEDIWLAFEPVSFQEDQTVYKAEEAYLVHDKTSLLLRCLTVERGFNKAFFIRMHQKDDGTITIGLDRLSRPEITDSVKKLIGACASRILQAEPEALVQSSNIEEFIQEG